MFCIPVTAHAGFKMNDLVMSLSNVVFAMANLFNNLELPVQSNKRNCQDTVIVLLDFSK